tara:strand:- start:1748 stop:2125 length:378 start_codon:yes stop_codon:yes gene_type:complete
MKITYEQLYRSYPVFKHLLDEPLPIGTARKIKGLVDSLNPHLEQIEATQNELIKKYGKETPEGYEILPEKRDSFVEELEKYLQYEILIHWEPISLSSLGEQISISIKGLATISYLLEDYEDMAVI